MNQSTPKLPKLTAIISALVILTLLQSTFQQPMENYWWEKLKGEDMNNEKLNLEMKNNKIIILDIFSRGCYYCFKLMPMWNELYETMQKPEFKDKVFMSKCDGPYNRPILEKLRIEGFPTLL